MAEMAQSFAAADANADGVLSLTEYIAWMEHFKKQAAEKGHFHDDRGQEESNWNLANRITPGVDGVSLQDCMTLMGVWYAKVGELKAAGQ